MTKETTVTQPENTPNSPDKLIESGVASICIKSVKLLTQNEFSKFQDQSIAEAVTNLNKKTNRRISEVSERKYFFKSEEYQKQRQTVIQEKQREIEESKEEIIENCQAIAVSRLSNIYETVISGWDIQISEENIAIAISSIQTSFTSMAENGFPALGIDRGKLKSLLDSKGIANNVNVYSEQELEIKNKEAAQVATNKETAKELGVSPEIYPLLLDSANQAYQVYSDLGPLHGIEKAPTFRVTASPLELPSSILNQAKELGDTLAYLASIVPTLDLAILNQLGGNTWISKESSFRLDTILDENGRIWLNEIQITDGADGLMVAEQQAYKLAIAGETTVDRFSAILKSKGIKNLAYLRNSLDPVEDPYISNRILFNKLLTPTNKDLDVSLISTETLTPATLSSYDGVVLSGYYPIDSLVNQFGLRPDQIVSVGDASVIGNKGLLALLCDPRLTQFWQNSIGVERFNSVRSFIPQTQFINSSTELESSLNNSNLVTKTYYDPRYNSISAMQGVFGPWSQSQDLDRAINLWDQGCRFVNQQFIKPKELSTLVRSNGGRTLEWQTGPNRICVKFVGSNLTATEATIGLSKPNDLKSQIIPAGRNCCFTPVTFN